MTSTWVNKPLGELVSLQRGFDLPTKNRVPGQYPVISAGESIGTHNVAKVKGPGFAIGRITNLGQPHWSDSNFWPLNTTLFATDFHGNNPKWLFYLFKVLDLRGFDSGSVQPSLNRNYISNVSVSTPPRETQDNIVSVLKSLDDKIDANNRIVDCTLELQRAHWLKALFGVPSIDLSEITSPVLGGTPKRSDEALWEGTNLWASVADMTKAPHSHLVDTAEKISDEAIQTRRFSPLPTGAILMSARGTVGRIVSTTKPTSFNQSAYGFIPPEGYGPALRLALSDVVAELKAKSYGSVFSTITKQQINECTVPDVFNPQFDELHTLLNTLESRIIAAELENQALARTRDELLPLLMSGRITVGEAEDAADEAASES